MTDPHSDGCGTGTTPPPPSTADILSARIASYPKHLKIAHINSQSLIGNIDEVRSIFSHQTVDLIGISETWLKPTVLSHEVALPGFKLLRNDRTNKRGGGVGIYVRNGLKCNTLFTSPSEYAAKPEFMLVEVLFTGVERLLLGICYRPPRIGHLIEFENALLRYMPAYTRVFVMGDLNTGLLMTNPNHDYNQLTTMFDSCNLTILPLAATHHTATSHTLLDLMVVSDPSEVLLHGQLPVPGVSHHDLIY